MKTKLILVISLLCILLSLPMVYATENTELDNNSHLSKEIGLFSNNFFEKTMGDHNIPGAVFVVVENGQVIFARGYGYANLENRIPVDPEKPCFVPGR